MLHAIYFTDPWDRGMGWTIRYSCVSERDRWTSHGMSHDPMGPWDGMDNLRHFWTALANGTLGHLKDATGSYNKYLKQLH